MRAGGTVADLCARIVEARQQNRLPHALLLITGDAGVARDLGEKVAKILLPDARAPDLFRLSPEGKMWQIGADRVRVIWSQIYKTAYGSGVRVVLILEADRLHRSAANSLLKALEEPPDGVYFLLTTSRPGEILPTLRSRCSVCACHDPTPNGLVPSLQEWVKNFCQFCQKSKTQPQRILDGYALIFRLRAVLDVLCGSNATDGAEEENRRRLLLATLTACGDILWKIAAEIYEKDAGSPNIDNLVQQTSALNRVQRLISTNCPEMAVLESVFFFGQASPMNLPQKSNYRSPTF